MSPRDPRLRPYRAALWALYFIVVLGGISLVTGSVVKTLWGSADQPAAAGTLPTRAALRSCLTDLEVLYREQSQRAWALGNELERADPLAAWNVWARDWERRLADVSGRCRLDSPEGEDARARAELAGARDALLALHRVYAAQVNRFARDAGDRAAAAAEAFAHARETVARTR